MTPAREPVLAILLFALAALASVFTAQYGFGLIPCELCLAQRVPYYIVVALTLAATLLKLQGKTLRIVLALCALAFAVDAGIALYHVGVEHHWWAGPQACTAGAGTVTSVEDLMAALQKPIDVPQCDKPAWLLAGISMAGYNLLACLIMSVFSALSARRVGAKR